MPRLHAHWGRDSQTGRINDLYLLECPRDDEHIRRRSVHVNFRNPVTVAIETPDCVEETLPVPLDRAAMEMLHQKIGEWLSENPVASGTTRP